MPPKPTGRRTRRASRKAAATNDRSRSPAARSSQHSEEDSLVMPPPPPTQAPAPFSLDPEFLLDGIYARMRRDGLLPSLVPPQTVAPAAVPPYQPQPGCSYTQQETPTVASVTSSEEVPAASQPVHVAQPQQGLVNQALAEILTSPGESRSTPPLLPSSNCVRVSAPLGAHVPPKIKSSIWEGQFINLNELALPQPGSSQDPNLKVHPPMSIQDWASAFQIYISIMTERVPQEAAGMLKHMATVQKLSKNHGPQAWRHYDQNFRWTKSFDQSLQWGQLDLELFTEASLLAIQSSATFPRPNNNKFNNTSPFRPNTCWSFQRHGRCSVPNCKFTSTHHCYNCKGDHSTSQCRHKTQGIPKKFSGGLPARRGGHSSNPK